MSVGIPLLIVPDGATQALDRVRLDAAIKGAFDEAWLQKLVHEHPECLPISEIEPGLSPFTAICREMPTARGLLDNLLVSGQGELAFVETKLFRNPEARRQVLAQSLDYATSLFAMNYEEFARAALAGQFSPGTPPSSLYAAVPDVDKLPEERFVDAVAKNLRRGRALILIAGDGIREDAQRLVDGLQTHGRFGFTLAFIELGVFRMPDASGRLLIVPRTLIKTAILQRTVVEIVGQGVPSVRTETLETPETLSAEAIWITLEEKLPGSRAKLEKFIQDIEPLGIYPEFRNSLMFKWSAAGGKPVNLGCIFKSMSVWTDLAAMAAGNEIAHTYVQEVADAFDCAAYRMPTTGNWTIYRDAKPVRLGSIIDRLDRWIEPMRRYIAVLAKYQKSLSNDQ